MDREKAKILENVEAAKTMVANNKDYTGARSKLLEIDCQFPGLKNVPQMITACEILCASELTLDGEPDWYWILQVSPQATANQLRLKYNKLVSLLEGIKDDFPGAMAALKLVHDASAVLLSSSKSWIFNSNRLTSKSFGESFVSNLSSLGDTMEDHNDRSLSQEQDSNLYENSKETGAAVEEGVLGVDENSLASIDIDDSDNTDNQWNKKISSAELSTVSSSSKLEETHYTEAFGFSNDEDIYNFGSRKKAIAFEVGQIWAAYDSEILPRKYAHINYVSESPFRLDVTWLRPIPKTDNETKWCEVKLPVVCGLFDLQEDEESLFDSSTLSHLVPCTSSPTYDEFEILPQEDELWAVYKDWKPLYWLENPEARKGCSLQVVQILEGYSNQKGILVVPLIKVNGSNNVFERVTEIGRERGFTIPSNHLYRFSHQLSACKLEGGKLIRVSSGMPNQDTSFIDPSTSLEPTISCSSSSRSAGNNNSLKVEWTGEDFAIGQVWAMYDGPDNMPRQYAVVNRVFSNEAVEVTYLEPHPNPMDNEEISWIEENLPKLEQKWKQQDFGNHHCRIVEIVSDFAENSGLQIANLEEVPGYKTFFQKQVGDGFALNQVIPRSEMLSFSHRIEAFVVPGVEAYGIPECSWHLEPDALPPLVSCT
ncbi:DnaJ-like protein subfamily B member 14 [Bienertia sinuspersici]